jgi:hypothetical protein
VGFIEPEGGEPESGAAQHLGKQPEQVDLGQGGTGQGGASGARKASCTRDV